MISMPFRHCLLFLVITCLGAFQSMAYQSPDLNNESYTSGPFVVSQNLVGQCTWYAYGRIKEVGLVSSYELRTWPNRKGASGIFLGNASTWPEDAIAAKNAGYPISTGSTPRVGALAVWSSNHVAFVEGVSGNSITVTESNNPPIANCNAIVCADFARLRSSMDASDKNNLI